MKLHEALEQHDLGLLESLIKKGADVNELDYDEEEHVYETPLIRACRFKFVQGIACLIRHGASIHPKQRRFEPPVYPLFVAISAHSLESVSLLLDHGADVNPAREDNADTPLHCAVFYDQMDICKELVKRGANLHARNQYGNMPFHYCFIPRRVHFLEFFFKHDPTLLRAQTKDGWLPVHLATHADILSCCIRFGANVRETGGCIGATALHRACEYNYDANLLPILVEHGANVNDADMYGNTPFSLLWDYYPNLIVTPNIGKMRYLLTQGAIPRTNIAALALQYDDVFIPERCVSMERWQRIYKANACIQLLVACKRIQRFGAGCVLDLLPLELFRVLHTFLR